MALPTLIITTYNWPAALDLTLQSVARQSLVPAEIIVADDGSGPETRQVVTRWQERLKTPLDVGAGSPGLKFQALATHLHHPLRHAQVGERNDAILRSTIEERKAWCPLGLSHMSIPQLRVSDGLIRAPTQ